MPKDLFIQLQSMVEERNSESLPVVMMAHTTLSGCDFSGHDNATERTVGGIDSCPLEQMGSYYDYLALGHIHKAQFVHGGNGRVRYCGTPLPISFDETSEHSVSLVEIESHGTTPKVETLPIDNPRPLVTIPDKGFLPWESIIQQIKEFPNDIPAYLKLNVEVENFLKANANYEALELLKNKKARLCQINAHRTIVQKKEHQGMTISELQQESPLSLLHRYAADKGFTIDEELENMFKSVLNND